MTESKLLPSNRLVSAATSALRSPWIFSMSGNRPGLVLPRLNSVMWTPRRCASSTIAGPTKLVPPMISQRSRASLLGAGGCGLFSTGPGDRGGSGGGEKFSTGRHGVAPCVGMRFRVDDGCGVGSLRRDRG